MADESAKVVMEEMSWQEIREAMERGTDTVVVMVGSVEQHGPQLPLATDSLIGHELAERLTRKLGRALAAPVIRPGCSEHHMSFPGTISIRAETLLEVLRDYCRSLSSHGFRKVVLASSHGGNFAPLEAFAPTLVREFPELRIIHYGDLRGFLDAYLEIARSLELDPSRAGIHAGLAETSQILALTPELVDENRFEPGYTGPLEGLSSRLLRDGLQVVTQNGVLGDPTGARAEIGEALNEALAEHLAEWARRELEA